MDEDPSRPRVVTSVSAISFSDKQKVLGAMKRKKYSSYQNGESLEMPKIGEDDDIVMWSRFGNDLSADIFTDVALRLPLRSVLACRCVCKTWRERVSDPEFAKLHFKGAKQALIFRTIEPDHVSRTLHILELENYNFEEHLRINLDTKLKLPLRDSKMVLNAKLDALAKAPFKGGSKSKELMATEPLDDKFRIVNSCNGLVCLSELKDNNPGVVCNPVTGEFMQLTGTNFSKKGTSNIIAGFGYCPGTNQYKVVRMYTRQVVVPDKGEWNEVQSRVSVVSVAEVQTLGSGLWKEVASAPNCQDGLKCPTYANDKVFWLFSSKSFYDPVVCFDVKTERFNSVALLSKRKWEPSKTTMGVLRDSLCICHDTSDRLRIWLMEDCAKSTWKKAFSIDLKEGHRPKHGFYYPMKLYDSGRVLIFHTSSCLIYYDPKKSGFKYFNNQGSGSKFEAVMFVPNLMSLKNLITGDGAEVQNVQSRCAQFRLPEEDLEFYIKNEDRDTVMDSEDSLPE